MACSKIEGFAISRSVTGASGSCKRDGPGLITRAHRGAPRECLRICKQAGPPPPRDLRDPVKHPGRVQARLEETPDQLLPSPLLPHHCALSPPPALARAPWVLGRQKFRFHCGVAAER